MSEFVYTVAPLISKIVLGYYFGPGVGQLSEPVVRYLLKRLKDPDGARRAASHLDSVGREVAVHLEAALIGDGATAQDLKVVSHEIAYSLQKVDIPNVVIAANLNSKEIFSNIVPKEMPIGISQKEHDLFIRSLEYLSEHLRRIAPKMESYDLLRDEEILTSLDILHENLEKVISEKSDIRAALEVIQRKIGNIDNLKERVEDSYRRRYISNIKSTLDYVEIIGLDDISREDRDTSLSISYLSLSVSGADRLPSDFSRALLRLFATSGRLIIEGGAGSGKSTLMRWAAIHSSDLVSSIRSERAASFRWLSESSRRSDWNIKLGDVLYSHVLESKKNLVWDFGAAFSLKNVKIDTNKIFGIGIHGNTERVPFLLRLRDCEGGLPSIDEFPTLLSPAFGNPPSGWVSRCLETGQAVLLFDGVDEVPDGEQRESVLRGILELANVYPKAAIVITTRPHAFDARQEGFGSFAVATVDDLSSDQQSQFVRNWHQARAAQALPADRSDYEVLADKLISKLELSSVLTRLATNPLLCASICALHEHSPEMLPEDERSLCADLTEMLADKRDRTSGRARALRFNQFSGAYRIPYEKKKGLLARLASEMLRSGSSYLRITEVERLLPAALRESGQSDLSPTQVCLALVARSGVLRAASYERAASMPLHGNDVFLPEAVEFIHNRFKEWLASTYFLSHGTFGELVARAHEEGFDQACVFAAAAPDQQAFVSSLIEGLLSRIDKTGELRIKRRLQVLVVRCATVAQSLPDEIRTMTDLLGRQLLPPTSMEESKALAELGDLAIDKILYRRSRGAKECTYCIRCLAIIDSAKAREALASYREDVRLTVLNELTRHYEPLMVPALLKAFATPNAAKGHEGQMVAIRRRARTIPDNAWPEGTQYLDLSGTSIVDIKAIRKLRSISILNISMTGIKEISALKDISKLKELYASSTSISEIAVLSGLTKLEQVTLSETEIENISPLSSCANLQLLQLDITSVNDLSPLQQLHKLKTLTLHSTKVLDLSPIANLLNLRELDLGRTKIADITAIQNLINLRMLGLHETAVEDLSPISNMKHLSSLYLGGTHVKSIEALRNLSELRHLVLIGTNVSDLSPIFGKEKLHIYTSSGKSVNVKDLSEATHDAVMARIREDR